MSQLKILKKCLNDLRIPYEEKEFKCVTDIFLKVNDDMVSGGRNGFVLFSFRKKSDSLITTWINQGDPEKKVMQDGLPPETSLADQFSKEYETEFAKPKQKRYAAPPKK